MKSSSSDSPAAKAFQRRFVTTRWSMVLHARNDGNSTETHLALAELCEAYWLPLYAFIRRQTPDVHEAQDLTQAFFTRLLEKDFLADVQPECGRFRAFLLAAVKHFLSNERDKARTLKRGGGVRLQSLDWQVGEQSLQRLSANSLTAERLFERQWALALLDRVLNRLKTEQLAAGKQQSFETLCPFLSVDRAAANYSCAAATLGMSTEAVRVAAHRLRKRYRFLLRDGISQTVDSPHDIDDELRSLFEVLS